MSFIPHRKKGIVPIREVQQSDIDCYLEFGEIILIDHELDHKVIVSIGQHDRENGSPKKGDMIAKNPKAPTDQWLITKEYYEEHYEEVDYTEESY